MFILPFSDKNYMMMLERSYCHCRPYRYIVQIRAVGLMDSHRDLHSHRVCLVCLWGADRPAEGSSYDHSMRYPAAKMAFVDLPLERRVGCPQMTRVQSGTVREQEG